MKIGILGHGYVGQAVAHSHQGHDIKIRDPKLGDDSATMEEIASTDIIYVCLPSPATANGACDTGYLERGLSELMGYPGMSDKPVICKTTALPTAYRALNLVYANIVHVPEFLVSRDHIQSYLESRYLVIGGQPQWCQRVKEILQGCLPVTDDQVIITDITTAALYKYMINAYLATKVTFMNEFSGLAAKLGVDYQDLVDITAHDDRIGTTHMQVPGPDGRHGWGGDCFPKDMLALIKMAKGLDLDFGLLACVNRTNHWHRDGP